MSHLISQITFKVFSLIIATMILLGSYFLIVSYLEAVENTENSEFRRLDGIIQSVSLYLEYDLIKGTSLFDQGGMQLNESVKGQMTNVLYLINSSNDLSSGISILIVDHQAGDATILDQNGTKSALTASNLVQNLIDLNPTEDVQIGIGADNYTNSIFYAHPVDFRTDNDISAYIFTIEYIGNNIAEAKSVFYHRAIISIIALLIIGLLGHSALKRIFKHEVSARKELKEYISLAEKRNEELEQLSFVLKKSENLILLADKNGRIEWLNESYHEKNNYSGAELESFVGKELAEVSHYPKIQSVIDEAVMTKSKVVYEAKSYNQDGSEFWASTTVTPIIDNEGEVQKLLFIDADITRLKLAEKEIANLANFTEEQTRPLIRIKNNGLVLYANEASESILHLWKSHVNEVITKKSILEIIRQTTLENAEKFINLECNNRIYNLRFFPVKEKDYVNIYGEDITEVQITEKENRKKALQLEQDNLSITDSINYARKIQEAILPDEDHIRQFFKNSFALSKPKDIVSGDFFWIYETVPQKEYLLALADCTGHGVPGAMMSIVGHSLLNEIVEGEECTDPAQILEILNKEIIKSLRQKTLEKSSDGMDVSVLRINLQSRTITFAGAYQQVYWINRKLNTYKGDRQPIGGLHHDSNRKFTNHTFSYGQGDSIYLTSDGFQDQFGGENNKKFLSRRLQELLVTSHKYSMQAQSHIFNQAFEEWRGQYEQIDDVSMIGIKF
ncbi:SpoIIE family protein phosphatase [Cryomorpha ignava]|uniref:SpoIIE family protein phosphatase n=1 Tax=Cryomorpha ignava TaxID=101383 RepID=A0A7K3WTL6_9FLAO|nr:SpoIIE family protein phosphatase [Cryomorpha ignava]NEN25020.1 SpoIIE family protein phosphatase [Cryomorpha ignava]